MNKRFIVVTGKGGVGKSTLSLALCTQLKAQRKKSLLVTLDEDIPTWAQRPDQIDWLKIQLAESAIGYVGKKLGSYTIAKWVCSNKFFSALLEMLPGFSYVIYLGHLMEKLHVDPDLIIVLDSPSSGHALTMFEACWNFKRVFGPGLLGDDLDKVLNFLYREDILAVLVAGLPGELPLTEGIEVRTLLHKLNIKDVHLVINHCLCQWEGIQEVNQLPLSLQKKVELEQKSLTNHSNENLHLLPLIAEEENEALIKKMAPYLETLVQGLAP